MKKISNWFWLFFSLVFMGNAYASSLSVSITATDNNGNTTSVSTPAALLAIPYVKKIDVTLSGSISSYTVTDASYSGNNWGVYFKPNSGSQVTCSAQSACDSTTITVDTNGLPTLPSGSSPYTFTNAPIALHVTITFPTPATTLPQDFVTAFGSLPVTIGYLYDSTGSGAVNGPDTATWQPDSGTLINPPTLALDNKSVIAQEQSFEVTNISPPSNLAAVCPATAAAPTTCVNDGTAAGATGVLASTSNNSVSGYVIGFWNDAQCQIGGFTFSPNWMAYNYNTSSPFAQYICPYTAWQTSLGTGGASSALGCAALTPVTFFTGSAISPTAETAAIPYINKAENPKLDLKNLISNPGQAFTATDSCISYVYLSASGSSQSTYTSGTIANGDKYGVVVWALNSASDSTYGTPNYSLAHSNIFYTTGVSFALASTVKSSSLNKTKDCFVVTAASGNENSLSVFYWRLLRDAYLTPMHITPFYYKHAQTWAQWLDAHPSLKPSLNFIFEKSGRAFYYGGEFVKKYLVHTKLVLQKLANHISILIDNKASAQELPANYFAYNEVPSSAPKNRSNFGFNQDTDQQNIDVVPEDMNNDPFFHKNGDKKKRLIPVYEFSLMGGILEPTDDKYYYDTYYSSQPTMYGQIGLARIFWKGNLGFSLGLQGRYLTNTQQDSVTVLGNSSQTYNRTFYAITAEGMFAFRYRNPNFLYLQPGFFVGGGATRFREEATPQGSTTAAASGVTDYSQIYEGGLTLDISLSSLAGQTSEMETNDLLNEIVFRLSGSYNSNPTKALSSTGYFLGAGFVFLLN